MMKKFIIITLLFMLSACGEQVRLHRPTVLQGNVISSTRKQENLEIFLDWFAKNPELVKRAMMDFKYKTME